MPTKALAAPQGEPIHVTHARQHVRQDLEDDDNLLKGLIATARQGAENATGRQLLGAKLRFTLDDLPWHPCSRFYRGDSHVPRPYVRLPRGPVLQVEAMGYRDASGADQALDLADFVFDLNAEPARIMPRQGKNWPVPAYEVASVWVDYWAGYATPFVADPASNAVALNLRTWPALDVGALVRLSNSGGNLPAPLEPQTDYFVAEVVAPGTYRLAETADGAAIDLTSVGTGAHYLGQPGAHGAEGAVPEGIIQWMLLRVADLYENRGSQAVSRNALTPLGFVDGLLDPYRVPAL